MTNVGSMVERSTTPKGFQREQQHASIVSSRRVHHAWRARRLTPYVCLIPTAAVVGGVLVFPIGKTFFSAFSNFNAIGESTGFDGLANFRSLIADPVFPTVMLHTLVWTAAITLVATPISVVIGVVLHGRFRLRGMARTIIFAPWAISFVYVATIWVFVFDPFYGAFNSLLGAVGVNAVGTAWLGQGSTAFLAVLWVGVQLTIPFTSIVTLAGLQSIPEDVVAAAVMDGTTRWGMLRHVTLPLIRPVLTVATVVNVLYIFNSFPIIWVMTQGGPANQTDTVVTYIYKLAFDDNLYGEAGALSLVGFLVLMAFSISFVRLRSKELFG